MALLVPGIWTEESNQQVSMYAVGLTSSKQIMRTFQNALHSSLVALFLANVLLPTGSCSHCMSVCCLSVYSLLTQQ